MPDFQRRRELLCRRLREAELAALLVTHPINVSYLSGFTGDDSYLLLDSRRAILVSDPRFATQLTEECPELEHAIRSPGQGLLEHTAKVIRQAGWQSLGFEANYLTYADYWQLGEELPLVTWRRTSGLVEGLREIKDKEELAHLQQALWVAEKAFGVLRAGLRSGTTEKALADELDHQMRLFGATRSSFSTIVAAGQRAALPHARPTQRVVSETDAVLIDWGAMCGGYHSDLTRLLAVHKIPPKLERVYGVVLKAQARAIAKIRPGATGHEVDHAAREVIAKSGYGKYFGHGLGHGLGLEIHEGPRLSRNQHRPLRAGMVVTVEPGIYLPGIGGVRIEDDVLVTRGGAEVLSSLPKSIEDILA